MLRCKPEPAEALNKPCREYILRVDLDVLLLVCCWLFAGLFLVVWSPVIARASLLIKKTTIEFDTTIYEFFWFLNKSKMVINFRVSPSFPLFTSTFYI